MNKTKNKPNISVIIIALICVIHLLSGCTINDNPIATTESSILFIEKSPDCDSVQLLKYQLIIEGTMHELDIENNCFVFITFDNKSYELLDAPKKLYKDGRYAKLLVNTYIGNPPIRSTCMVGQLVKVERILKMKGKP